MNTTQIALQTEAKPDPALVAALATVEESRAIVIKTPEDRARAEAVAIRINNAIKIVKALTQPPVDIANEAADKARAHRDKYLVPLENEKKAASRRIGDAMAEEARKAEEERRKAEQVELEKQIARQKAEAEAAAAKAVALDKAGLKEEANVAMAEAVAIEQKAPEQVYVAPAKVAKSPGVSAPKKSYDIELTDAALVPREYMEPDLVKIRKVVNAMGGNIAIPGIKIIPVNAVSLRSA